MQTKCLNVSKTELVLFRSAKKQLDFGLKLKLNGKRLYPTNSVKYLRVKIDKHMTWKPHIDEISTKLNKANAMLSKIRHFVDQKTLTINLPCYIQITLSLLLLKRVWQRWYRPS